MKFLATFLLAAAALCVSTFGAAQPAAAGDEFIGIRIGPIGLGITIRAECDGPKDCAFDDGPFGPPPCRGPHCGSFGPGPAGYGCASGACEAKARCKGAACKTYARAQAKARYAALKAKKARYAAMKAKKTAKRFSLAKN